MSDYDRQMDVADLFHALARRITELELAGSQLRRFTTSSRPPATAVEGMSIYNTTTKKVQTSDGTSWNDHF